MAILKSLQALGISQVRWLADYFRLPIKASDAELAPLVESGDVIVVDVAGWDQPAYVHHAHADLLARASAGRLRATHTALLSPFDPVVWDRRRASTMFGFNYTLECYTPASKRSYGYFCLPLLWRGQLIGRVDAKAHRREGVFEIRVVHLETGIEPGERLAGDLAKAIIDCAAWHGTPQIRITRSEPRGFARMLAAQVRSL